MSVEHEPANPRLDPLLRQIVAADLGSDQNARVRARLGLTPQPDLQPRLTLPASNPAPIRTQEQEGPPMIATTAGRLRQQWLQFAMAAVAFIAVGVVLAMVFGSGSNDRDTRPGTASSPTAGLMDNALTVEEAQERLAFDLILPESWPGSLSIAGVFVTDDNRMATIWLTETDETVPAFTITQTTESVQTPDADDMQQTMLDSMDQPPATELPAPTQTTVIIAGRTILQTIVHDANAQPIHLYSWNQGDIHIDVDSFNRSRGEVEQIVAALASLPDSATSEMEPSALPTPDGNGTYRGITIEQARQIVPFEVVFPERVPDGFEPPELSVVELRAPVEPRLRGYRVEMVYELSGADSRSQSVTFTQFGPNGDLQFAETESTMGITANGVEATRIEARSTGGDPILAYTWEHDGLHYMIFATPAGNLTPELVDALMQDIFAIYTPTVESESARLEQERAAMTPFPVPETCAATDWVGPDFRVGQQYASAYFLDGAGLSLGTTHGLIFGGENQISWFADAPLTTAEALSGPGMIRAVQPGNESSAMEIQIEVIEQIDGGGKDPLVERAWWTNVNFPSDGCWELSATLGQHSLTATVYVYPPPDTSGITYDEARVEEIAMADPRVQALLADHPHQVSGVGMWTGEWGRLVGGIVVISVGGPRNIAGEWFEFSMLDCVTQPPPDPVVVSYRAEFSGVTEIHVLVDLSTEAVVTIWPFGETGASLVGEREFTGEYDEIRQCDSQD